MRRLPTLAFVMFAAAWSPGCSHAAPNKVSIQLFDTKDDTPARLRIDGVPFEIAGALKSDMTVVTHGATAASNITISLGNGPPPFDAGKEGVWVRGRGVTISDGRLHVGEADFGPVDASTTVTMDAAGVHLNGELRGKLPEPR